jgi:ferrous iron transport protein B
MILALVGNQNCGKTALFNQMTGANQHVGNFPGVTVEKKEGIVRKHKDITLVDLPGIYSLSPYSPEETIARDFLIKQHLDGIINIVDATNMERNLYLTVQLAQLQIPMVVALNMMDEVRLNKGSIKTEVIQDFLGVPVLPISALKNEGIDELIETVVKTVQEKYLPKKQEFYPKAAQRAQKTISSIVEKHMEKGGINPEFIATKLIEKDAELLKSLKLTDSEALKIENSVREMEAALGTDGKAAMADIRYSFIEKLCSKAVAKPKLNKHQQRSIKIDDILINKYLALPIFLGIMMLIFWLTFGVIGSFLSDLLSSGIDALANVVADKLALFGLSPVVESLVIDGIFAGVGSVLSFIPTIMVLFFFLSLLEDTGYMARVAFIMDRIFRKIGLSGRSIVPFLIGFGCTVPAIMSTRTLRNERDKKLTLYLTPFMSCSAKLPI